MEIMLGACCTLYVAVGVWAGVLLGLMAVVLFMAAKGN